MGLEPAAGPRIFRDGKKSSKLLSLQAGAAGNVANVL